MKNRFAPIALSATILALPNGAQAGFIEIETEIDLNAAQQYGSVVFGIYSLPTSVLVSAGDTVDMTVRFQQGQRIEISALGSQPLFLAGWLGQDYHLSIPGTSNFTITQNALDFIGLRGYDVGPLRSDLESDGSAHLGPLFDQVYMPMGESFSFAGYRTQFTVAELENGSGFYVGPFLEFAILNGGGSVNVKYEVPEPAPLFLLSAGVASLGGLRRTPK